MYEGRREGQDLAFLQASDLGAQQLDALLYPNSSRAVLNCSASWLLLLPRQPMLGRTVELFLSTRKSL